jgi:hypothetical protein
MLVKAANNNHIKGIGCDLRPRGVICLQYADDTILFSDCNTEFATILKMVLTCFEQVSGMQINYNKSELIPLCLEELDISVLADIFGCTIGTLPIKYIGITLHFDKLRRVDIQPFIDKILKRISVWRGELLSYATRVILIKACLASIPIYLLSFSNFQNRLLI